MVRAVSDDSQAELADAGTDSGADKQISLLAKSVGLDLGQVCAHPDLLSSKATFSLSLSLSDREAQTHACLEPSHTMISARRHRAISALSLSYRHTFTKKKCRSLIAAGAKLKLKYRENSQILEAFSILLYTFKVTRTRAFNSNPQNDFNFSPN